MTSINFAESQNLPLLCLPRSYFLLSAIVALHLSRVLYKFAPFYAKQTQFADRSNKRKLIHNKGLRKCSSPRTPQKQTQFVAA
jgi:hypothetical protein